MVEKADLEEAMNALFVGANPQTRSMAQRRDATQKSSPRGGEMLLRTVFERFECLTAHCFQRVFEGEPPKSTRNQFDFCEDSPSNGGSNGMFRTPPYPLKWFRPFGWGLTLSLLLFSSFQKIEAADMNATRFALDYLRDGPLLGRSLSRRQPAIRF